jgi:hypothetical protein
MTHRKSIRAGGWQPLPPDARKAIRERIARGRIIRKKRWEYKVFVRSMEEKW